jgi:hypothetical protein
VYVSKIRCDGESGKFCKIFWELNWAFVQSRRAETGEQLDMHIRSHRSAVRISSPRSALCSSMILLLVTGRAPSRARIVGQHAVMILKR